MPARFKLPARIRKMRVMRGNFSAKMALIDRIADLPGIETIERNDESIPRRVDVYLRQETSGRMLQRKAPQLLCGLDCSGVVVSGLNLWERYQVLANGWGKLVGDQVYVHLPRDQKELEIVWSIIRRAYDGFFLPTSTRGRVSDDYNLGLSKVLTHKPSIEEEEKCVRTTTTTTTSTTSRVKGLEPARSCSTTIVARNVPVARLAIGIASKAVGTTSTGIGVRMMTGTRVISNIMKI
jgi:hypothetical protein